MAAYDVIAHPILSVDDTELLHVMSEQLKYAINNKACRITRGHLFTYNGTGYNVDQLCMIYGLPELNKCLTKLESMMDSVPLLTGLRIRERGADIIEANTIIKNAYNGKRLDSNCHKVLLITSGSFKMTNHNGSVEILPGMIYAIDNKNKATIEIAANTIGYVWYFGFASVDKVPIWELYKTENV